MIISTLAHLSDRAIEARHRMGWPDSLLNKMKRIQLYGKGTFKKIHLAGIKIAMGIDIGVYPEFSPNAFELELYVNDGMTPMEPIQTAAKNAAGAIWFDKVTRTLESGKLADIIAVEGNPLTNISILQNKEKSRW